MIDLIQHGLKMTHLRLLALLAETGQIGIAAARLGIAQPAASRLLAEAEAIARLPLRRRDGRGITLTPEGAALAARAQRVLTEIGAASRELSELSQGTAGHVRLGAVTGAAVETVIPALRAARVSWPGITVEVEVGTSDLLAPMVQDGRLDFALCRLTDGIDPLALDLQMSGAERVSLVVRRDHALAGATDIAPARLMEFDWILPGRGNILRRTVLDRLAVLGLPLPPVRMSTSSFLLTLAWLSQSNAIAPLANSVARQFTSTGDYAILTQDLDITIAPYGLLTRRDGLPTPSAARILALLQQPA